LSRWEDSGYLKVDLLRKKSKNMEKEVKMKLIVVYDNEAGKKGLFADWGFSLFVDGEKKILFDTGRKPELLENNLEVLGIDVENIDFVFISHPHHDHAGGLSYVLEKRPGIPVYVPAGWKKGENFIEVPDFQEISPGVYSTGTFGIEHAMVLETPKGAVVVVGCCHPGLSVFVEAAKRVGKVYMVIGGLHSFRDFSLLEKIDIIYPCHCTEYKERIASLYPEKYHPCHGGLVISF